NVVSVARDIKARDRLPRVSVKDNQFRGTAARDEEPVVGFIECHRKVCGGSVRLPRRDYFAFVAVDYRDLSGIWHIHENAPPFFFEFKSFWMRREFDRAGAFAIRRVDNAN